MSNAIIEAPDDQPEEPNFPGCSAHQSRFVRHFVEQGGKDAKAAALAAGYSPTCAAESGYRALRVPAVREAIQAEMLAAIGDAAPGALMSMVHLSRSAKSEMVRQVAAKDLLDRAGFKPPDRLMVAHGGSVEVDIKLGE